MKKSVFKILSLFILSLLLSSCFSGGKKIQSIKHNYSGFELKTEIGNCIVRNDQIDQLTGDRITELQKEIILRYTHPKLRKYFKEEPFVIVQAALTRVNKKQFLCNFTFDIYARSLQQNYLGIEEGSYLKIHLINGEDIILQGISSSEISLNRSGRNEIEASYLINSKDINSLKNFEVDLIGVTWIGGFETYPVHEIDFLMKQFDCFSKIN